MSTRTTRGGTRRTGEVSGRPALATALGDTDTPTRTQAVGPLAAARSTSAGVAAPLADQDPRARTGEGRHVRCGSDSRPTSRCPPARTGAERCTEPQWPRQPSRPTARPRRPPRPQPPGGYIPTSARVAAPDDPATPGVAPIRGQPPAALPRGRGRPTAPSPSGRASGAGSATSTPAGASPAPGGLHSRHPAQPARVWRPRTTPPPPAWLRFGGNVHAALRGRRVDRCTEPRVARQLSWARPRPRRPAGPQPQGSNPDLPGGSQETRAHHHGRPSANACAFEDGGPRFRTVGLDACRTAAARAGAVRRRLNLPRRPPDRPALRPLPNRGPESPGGPVARLDVPPSREDRRLVRLERREVVRRHGTARDKEWRRSGT